MEENKARLGLTKLRMKPECHLMRRVSSMEGALCLVSIIRASAELDRLAPAS